jgi:hypothetical protein
LIKASILNDNHNFEFRDKLDSVSSPRCTSNDLSNDLLNGDLGQDDKKSDRFYGSPRGEIWKSKEALIDSGVASQSSEAPAASVASFNLRKRPSSLPRPLNTKPINDLAYKNHTRDELIIGLQRAKSEIEILKRQQEVYSKLIKKNV